MSFIDNFEAKLAQIEFLEVYGDTVSIQEVFSMNFSRFLNRKEIRNVQVFRSLKNAKVRKKVTSSTYEEISWST